MSTLKHVAVALQILATPVVAQHAHVGPTLTGGVLDLKTGYYPSENFTGGTILPKYYRSPLPITGGSNITEAWINNGNSLNGLTLNDGDYYRSGPYHHIYKSTGWDPNYYRIDQATRYAIHNGTTPANGSIVTAAEIQRVTGGQYDGWYQITTPLNPTTDFFAMYLSGTELNYEIVSLSPAHGKGNADAIFDMVWEKNGVTLKASSSGTTRAERSLSTPAPTHRHGYKWYISKPGDYDVTWRVWDANDVAQTAAPGGISDVRFRIRVVPEPAALGLVALLPMVMRRRRS